MYEVFFYICELRQQIMKYSDFSLENADLDHMVRFFIFRWGSVRCRLPIDFGLCMVKTIVCSLRHFTLTNFPIWIWQIHNLYVSYPYSNSLSPQLQWSRNVFERWTMSVLVGMDWA